MKDFVSRIVSPRFVPVHLSAGILCRRFLVPLAFFSVPVDRHSWRHRIISMISGYARTVQRFEKPARQEPPR